MTENQISSVGIVKKAIMEDQETAWFENMMETAQVVECILHMFDNVDRDKGVISFFMRQKGLHAKNSDRKAKISATWI